MRLSMMTLRLVIVLCLLVVALQPAGCRRVGEVKDATTQGGEIVVAAAANLNEAFTELGRRFTDETGVRVTFSFGSTADLARQIENGAPFDVFASADAAHVERLISKGLLVPESRVLYAHGRLVLWIPPSTRAAINSLEDVARAEVKRVAVAKPELAPYGRAAVESLQALNLWAQVEPKVVYGQSVTQAKQFASTGDADVAFLPRALVEQDEGRAIDVDEKLHQPINQAMAVVRASGGQDAARSFVDYVMSERGQAILERYGYARPSG